MAEVDPTWALRIVLTVVVPTLIIVVIVGLGYLFSAVVEVVGFVVRRLRGL